MTEAKWNTSTDSLRLLSFAAHQSNAVKARGGGFLSDRKLRLYLVACCRRRWELFEDEGCRAVVDLAEQLAERKPKQQEWVRADEASLEPCRRAMKLRDADDPTWRPRGAAAVAASNACEPFQLLTRPQPVRTVGKPSAPSHIRAAGGLACLVRASPPWLDNKHAHPELVGQPDHQNELAAQASLLRCIAGNPFRPVAADPAWLTSTAVGLASAIYAERAFDRLPVLADALEDVGCDNTDVLAHCRSHPEHARGCWVVDLILGKC